MKVILTTNIKRLGSVGDRVEVKDGFARNFLFPNKMALRNTKLNLEYFEKIREEVDLKENKKKKQAIDLIEEIKKIKIEFVKEADEKDQLYGSITKKELINFFNDKNIKIISDDIKITNSIRSLGVHLIEVSPYEGLKTELKIVVKKT